MTGSEILEKIREAGVVGAGGAGFPTHVKLAEPCEYVLVNGAECEPLLAVDQQLAAAHAEKMFVALEALLELTGALKAVLAFKGKYHDAIARIEALLPGHPRVSLHVLPNVYPAGDEQVLVCEVFGRIVPEGGIPLAVGVVVVNVETLLNVADALEGRPVTNTWLTVCGCVRRPATLKAPLGVSFSSVLEACGGMTIENWALIEGGPMMGKLVPSLADCVTKTTKGLIALPADHPLIVSKSRPLKDVMKLAKTACCHCMLCTDLCPRYLLGHSLHPDKLMRLAAYNDTCERDASATEAFLCCECGLCETACIMGLQPWKLNRELKRRMAAVGVKNPHAARPAEVNPFRSVRPFSAARLLHRLGLAEYATSAPLDEALVVPAGRVTLKLKQHLGAPAVPEVAVGEWVERGQRVACGEGAVSAHVHSPVSGVVASVEADRITVESARP